jgi:hypothetical protein
MNSVMFCAGLLAVGAVGLGAASAQPARDSGAVPPSQVAGNSPGSVAPSPASIATLYPTAVAALRAVLQSEPRVLAVGEFHQTKATARIPSALKRFTRQMLAPLRAAGATDLVVETWFSTGSCGDAEKKTVVEIESTTERPPHSEDEVVNLLLAARQTGMESRILEVACKDYQAIVGTAKVDFERLLRFTRDQLEAQIRAALARPGSRMVVSYGGALHNDLQPAPELAPYAFGQAVSGAVGGRYLELDLYVPEFIEKNAGVRAQPWFDTYRRTYRRGQVTLVRRSDSSFALVFPRTR